jgi:hypothetical protein
MWLKWNHLAWQASKKTHRLVVVYVKWESEWDSVRERENVREKDVEMLTRGRDKGK